MGIEGLIISIGGIAFGLIIGYLYGIEKECRRIYEAFRYEDYTYESFYDVLEKYEKIKQ